MPRFADAVASLDQNQRIIYNQFMVGQTTIINNATLQGQQTRDAIRDQITKSAQEVTDHVRLLVDGSTAHAVSAAEQQALAQQRERFVQSLHFPEINARKNQVGQHARCTFGWLFSAKGMYPVPALLLVSMVLAVLTLIISV
jgi:hypothetical protein